MVRRWGALAWDIEDDGDGVCALSVGLVADYATGPQAAAAAIKACIADSGHRSTCSPHRHVLFQTTCYAVALAKRDDPRLCRAAGYAGGARRPRQKRKSGIIARRQGPPARRCNQSATLGKPSRPREPWPHPVYAWVRLCGVSCRTESSFRFWQDGAIGPKVESDAVGEFIASARSKAEAMSALTVSRSASNARMACRGFRGPISGRLRWSRIPAPSPRRWSSACRDRGPAPRESRRPFPVPRWPIPQP